MNVKGYLVSVPIPWNKDGSFLPDMFTKAVNKLIEESCDGLYIFGTSGEGYAVTDNEFTEIVKTFVDATKEFDGFNQVGCFGLSSDQVKNRCEIAVNNGVKNVQITLPFWKELNNAELERYFSDVCRSFPEVSFLLYNNPRNKRRLNGKELQRFHDIAPNLIGAKTGSGSWIDIYELITEAPSLINFVTEASFLFAYDLGNVGLIPSSNYVFPSISKKYYESVINKDFEKANILHKKILRFFYKTAIPLVQKGYIDGAIDKAYAQIGGMEMPLFMKSPYISISEKDFEWLKMVIKSEFEKDVEIKN